MKKLLKSLAFLAVAAVAQSAFAGAQWLGNSYIQANDVWYQAHGTEAWATGGAFDGCDLGTVTNIKLGGQLQIGDNGNNWGSGSGDWMNYSIDGGEAQHINLSYESYGYGEYNNNMRFQSGGGNFATTSIDVSGLSEGRHTIAVSFGPVDGVYENSQPSATLYTAGFMVAAGGGGGTVVTTNTVTYTVTATNAVSVTGTEPTGASSTYLSTYGTKYQLTKDKSMTLTLSGYEGVKITGLTLSMKSNAKAGAGTLSVTCGAATIASIANAAFSNAVWYGSYSGDYVDITPFVTATTVGENENIVITIAATTNSLYCQSFAVTYEETSSGPTSFSISLAPSAAFRVEKDAAASVEATPTAAAAGSISYAWTIDGVAAGGNSYILDLDTTTAGGPYTVVCTATDSASAQATASVDYTVYETYAIAVDDNIEHGSISTDVSRAEAGDTVTVIPNPDLGWGNAVITVDGDEIPGTTFTMPAHGVTVSATFSEVQDYATLPFEHTTGWYGVTNVTGLTSYGIGSDYSSGDGAKINSEGAWVQVKFAGTASEVVYTIKQNGTGSAAYEFDVQESATGADNDWQTLAAFTDSGTTLPSSETTYTNAMSASARFVRFYYKTKPQGINVGLYDIYIDAEVPVTKYNVTIDEGIVNGTVTADKAEAAEGATVTVTATPDRGYALVAVTVDGSELVGDSFEMPAHDVEISATFTAVPVYKRVESADDFVTGAKYLVVAYKDGNNGYTSALKNEATANNQIAVDETISIEFADDGKFISVDSAAIVWQILHTSSVAGEYVLFNEASNVYAAAKSNANNAQLLPADDGNLTQWTFDFADVPEVKMYSLAYPERWLQRNGTANNKFFATYNTTGTEPWLFIDTTTDSQLVNFDWNDGSGTVTTMRYVKGDEYPWFERIVKNDAWLIGWFDAPTGGNRVMLGTVTSADERTLYAQWLENQTVWFNPNGGTCETTSLPFAFGGTYSGLPTPVWDGHDFQGWFTSDGTQVANGDDVIYAKSLSLVAHWAGQDSQTVTFNAGGGTCSPATLVCGIGATYPTFPTPQWTGHVFLGWYDAAQDGTRVLGGMEVTEATSRTLYAYWTSTQTVRFAPNGGTCDTASIQCQMGGVYPALPVPTWDGHTFLGWFTEAGGGTVVAAGDTVTLESTRTLFARWEGQESQLVTFDARGGTCKKSSMTVAKGSTYPTFPTPKLAGYTFKGWYTDPDAGKRIMGGMDVTEADTLKLYVHWKAASTMSISGFSMSSRAASGARAAQNLTATIEVETVADVIYQIQWTPSLGGDWSVLKRWTAEKDGKTDVTVSVPAGETSGFFRLVEE